MPTPHASEAVLTVSELTGQLRQLLELSFRNIWIEGEISSLAKPASGHLYFSLKEDKSIIRCAFFRNRQQRGQWTPTEGAQVLVRGQVSVYEARGDMQLIVSYIEPSGEGALRRAFELLKKKLHAEGLFDPEAKSDIPEYVSVIGVITSPTGAVIKDVYNTVRRRMPSSRIILYPVRVQGQESVAEISRMIEVANDRNECDVLILCRGGGSLEDLQSFNDEQVARAVHVSAIPIISAVGHETDTTICDLVADLRAATPTAAAEISTMDQQALRYEFLSTRDRLLNLIERKINDLRQHTDFLCSRLLRPESRIAFNREKNTWLQRQMINHVRYRLRTAISQLENRRQHLRVYAPANKLADLRSRKQELQTTLVQTAAVQLSDQRNKLSVINASLTALSPHNTLARGFSILQKADQRIVTHPENLANGESLRAIMAGGTVSLTVEK
ncbi:MAG: exodeoxyribonuclease VII large subunit [Pseudomonadota bacterium]